MSQYNKTVLTNAGLALAKRANAGQAKFEITRAVTSADDWSNKTIQDLEEATAIPNIMQKGTIMDAEEVESNNSVIGVSLCFANKDLSAGYQIKIIGVYVREEGQDKDFLYAVTTAVTPEYMPDFSDGVLYRFNMQIYLVIGKAQAVNVVINDGASVTHGQLDKYKGEVTANLEKIENAHKEDMSHVAKSASINGGAEILPDSTGKLNLVVPDPDLSRYVSLEQLGELLKTKADITAVPDKTDTEEGIRQAKADAKAADDKAQRALDSKADKTDVYTKKAVDDAFNTRDSNITNAINLANQAQATANTKANASDVYTKAEVNNKTSGTIVTAYDVASKNSTKETDSYTNRWLVDQSALWPFADQINELKGRRSVEAPDFNNLTDTGTYYVSNPGANKPTGHWGTLAVFNGNSQRLTQLYFADDGMDVFVRSYAWHNGKLAWDSWNQIAWKNDVTALQNTVNNIDSTRTPIVAGASGDDLFAFKKNQIRLYNGNGKNCKNLPPAKNTNWFSVQYIFEGPGDNGVAIYRTPANEIWTAGCNGASYTTNLSGGGWLRVANANDITNLQNQINTKLNETDTVNVVNSYDINSNQNGGLNKWPIKQAWYVDQNALRPFADQINQLKGRRSVEAPDFNNLTDTGTYYVSNPGANKPTGHWGTLAVFNGNSQRLTQLYFADDGMDVFVRSYAWHNGKLAWDSWNQIAWKSDVTALQNTVNQQNQTIQSLTTRLTNAENEIRYIKDNYIEGKRFPAELEGQAEAWEYENPQRIAFITK